jgi:predicted dehydrogenase
MPLKVALVGCGKIADGHIEEIQKMPKRAHVIAVCDRELLMAEQIAGRYAVPAYYDDVDRMLAAERPDVVHITTPPGSHLALARKAFEAGCHVFVEKPLALDSAEAVMLVEEAKRHGKKVTIGYTYLFDPVALQMRTLLASGAVGDVVHVESWFGYNLAGPFGSAILGDAGHWVHGLPGKLFHNNIDHLLNKLVEFIDDEQPRIEAHAWRQRPQVFGDSRDDMPDELRISIYGKRVSAYGTFTSHVKPAAHFVRVYGTKSIMHVDYVSRTATLDRGTTLPSAFGRLTPAFGQALQYLKQGGRNAAAFARADFQFFSGLNRLIGLFYDSITEGAPAPISTEDMLRISRWMDQIFRSIGTGGRP